MPILHTALPSRLRRRASLLAALTLGCAALIGVSTLRGQSATIGYNPVADTDASASSFSAMNPATGFIMPFQFNSLGDYSLTSASFLLSGNASLADFSVSVSSTLPANLTALTSFATTGTLSSTPTAYTFNVGATPTLTANTTYYFRFVYTGINTANWIKTDAGTNSGSGGIPPLTFISSAFAAGTSITYRTLTSGGFTDGFDNIGAFSITANAVSAVPEPSTYAALAGAGALAAAVFVRRRRRARG